MSSVRDAMPLRVVHFGQSRLVGWFGTTELFPDGWGPLGGYETGYTEFFLDSGSIVNLPMTESGAVGWTYDPNETIGSTND